MSAADASMSTPKKFRPGSKYVAGQRPSGHKGDCAFPCATEENKITAEDAKKLVDHSCYLSLKPPICRASAAVDLFIEKKILFGPGKAANAGGVATSGLEMSQNSMRLPWPREEVDSRLRHIMSTIFKICSEPHGNLRKAPAISSSGPTSQDGESRRRHARQRGCFDLDKVGARRGSASYDVPREDHVLL